MALALLRFFGRRDSAGRNKVLQRKLSAGDGFHEICMDGAYNILQRLVTWFIDVSHCLLMVFIAGGAVIPFMSSIFVNMD